MVKKKMMIRERKERKESREKGKGKGRTERESLPARSLASVCS